MYDINKFIANERMQINDPQGYLAGLDHWSPLVANRRAEEEAISLSEEHWQVIYCLREWFRLLGPDWTARQMTHKLEREYGDVGGRRYLYDLFPHGPLAQGCRLAGLPLPQGTLSSSFGSVH
ncbi:MAG TPA: TusE/DsrC/DsvC family sulfur relay protein [Rhodocyclaceae bacterium]|nr:TusE/DsrC/DsvC family sulfur relay protein [Rhodocyclaceae bacterium]